MSRAWMPLYVADYLADTAHLSAAEHGGYLLLIMHYWQHGGLPDDPKRLARIARMTLEEWGNAQAMLSDFFKPGWKHDRIDAELALAREKYEKRAAAGRKGGRASVSAKNQEKTPPSPPSNAEAMLEPGLSNAEANGVAKSNQSQPHINTSPNGEDAASASRPSAPAFVDATDELWKDGKLTLVQLGLTEKNAGSMIGKWLRDTGGNAVAILEAINRARDERTGSPIPFITQSLPTKRRNANGHPHGKPRSNGFDGDAFMAAFLGQTSGRSEPDWASETAAGPCLDLAATSGGRGRPQ